MAKDELVQKAEQEVIEAAKELVRQFDSAGRTLTATEQRLRMAIFMLRKAKGLSGMYRITLPDAEDPEE